MKKLVFTRRCEIVSLLANRYGTGQIMRETGIAHSTIAGVLHEVGEACLYYVGRTAAERAKIREWGWKRIDSKMKCKAIVAVFQNGMKPEDIVEQSDKWWKQREEEQFEEAFSKKLKLSPSIRFEVTNCKPPERDRATGVGYCACGCGEETERATCDDRARRLKKGDFNRYVHGHYSRMLTAQKKRNKPDYVTHCERQKKRDELRMELVEEVKKNPGVSRNYIFRKYAEKGWEPEAVSRILRTGIEDRSFGLNDGTLATPELEPPAPAVPLQLACFRCKRTFETFQPRQLWCSDECRFPKSHAPYERREISYEHETELPLLVNSRWVASLDEEIYEDGGTRHDVVASSNGFDWGTIMDPEDRDAVWWRAFERSLPPKVGSIYRRIQDGERVTREEETWLRAEALLLFQDFAE